MDKVEQLTQLLIAQQTFNSSLQTQLRAATDKCADLQLQLRTLKPKRTRSADATAGSTSEASMDSDLEPTNNRRRSPGRANPSHV